jgi:hypothetical protein
MPFWQRLMITIFVMLAASYGGGVLWSSLLNANLPSYLSGLLGGLSAIPVWEFLKRVGPGSQP